MNVISTQVTQVDWANDAETAIELLKSNPKYDIICFDHDLADEHYMTSASDNDYGKEMTGFDVAIALITEIDEEKQPDYAIVHSFSPHGSKRITSALTEGGLQKAIYVFPFNANGFRKAFSDIMLKNGN
jgi:hypothetical protein